MRPGRAPDSHEPALAAYAATGQKAIQRLHFEPDDPLRTAFELDRNRIISSTAFRRLEGKTQVFLASHHDHFRTRLTHTFEVTQIARGLAKSLHVNEALAEAITLAHDLGHPPFGHAGEVVLNRAMAACGGFNHNLHSLRVVEYLEHPFPAFRGLNLTSATRAGLAAHATRYDAPAENFAGPSVEAQVASIADRIAYNCHDLEDAIGADLIGIDELSHVPLWESAYQRVTAAYGRRPIHAIRRPVLDGMVDSLLTDVIQNSRGLLAPLRSPDDVATANAPLVALSPQAEPLLRSLEDFLSRRVYQHPDVADTDSRGQRIVAELFECYRRAPQGLPARFAARIDEQRLERVIGDYIAGMTDRFCEREHERLVRKSVRESHE